MVTAAASGVFKIGGDLPVHRLGYGAMRITGTGIWGSPADRAEALATLRRALDLGVTFIDTAESYGPFISEELIAEALHPYPQGLVIATKGGLERPGPNQWVPDGRPARLRQALEGSLRRLRLERIDLYQLHRVDTTVPADEQFGFLKDVQSEGLVRHVGLSEVDVPQIERARTFFTVASVQNKYNVGDRQWEAVVDYCDREGIAFIPWYPLQVGDEALATIAGVAKRHHGATPHQIALAWLLQRASVMLPIPGTSRRTHLEENVGASGIRLTEKDLRELKAI